MTLRDTFGLSLRNLAQSKLRTALTALGVSIGIASLTGMVSLGVGLQDQIVGRFLKSGLFDSITVLSASLPAGRGTFAARGGLRGGLRGSAGPTASGAASKLNDEALRQISALENVREAYPNLRLPVEVKFGGFTQMVTASGVPMSAKAEGAFQTLSHGAFFSDESDNACILTLDMAKQIAEQDTGTLIGKNLTLAYAASRGSANESEAPQFLRIQRVEIPCRIAGIVERDPGPLQVGGPAISGVMLPMRLAQTIDGEIVTDPQSLLRNPSGPKTYSSITVKVKQARYTQAVEEQIRRLGYPVFSANDALRGANVAFIILDIILSLIGSIALAVSSLGIVNTMMMSILERRREIGIMKAIGAGDADIRRIFLIEASVIGFAGGIVGIALGWGIGRVVNIAANIYIQSQGGTSGTLFSLPFWLTAGALIFSIVVSLIAGGYPASRAARLDPIHALRHD
jgi:putative ABC transport system permease protein